MGPDATNNPNQYTSRENDNTGLQYYRARYYDPVLKRFISSDPIGLGGGMNMYGYVEGDPLMFTDPLGLDPICGQGRTAIFGGAKQKYAVTCVPNNQVPDPQICVTGECAAGLLPAPPENRTNEQIQCDLDDRTNQKACKKICKTIVSVGVKVPLAPSLICKMVCPKHY